jgi:hypothetical protein
MLLLWMSVVCMIPFDMVRLDSNVTSESGEKKQPVMDRILNTARVRNNHHYVSQGKE